MILWANILSIYGTVCPELKSSGMFLPFLKVLSGNACGYACVFEGAWGLFLW